MGSTEHVMATLTYKYGIVFEGCVDDYTVLHHMAGLTEGKRR